MDFCVKNTTFVGLGELVAPHICRGCGRTGEVFCECCKNNIILARQNYCLNCKRVVTAARCPHCQDFPPTYMVGWRDEMVGRLVEEYKYHSVRQLGVVLAELLDEILPMIDGEVAVIPLPTITKHIRARGFDHTLGVARKLARRRGWKVAPVLKRAKDTVQVGAGNTARLLQAAEAYSLDGKIEPDTTYILLDDVWTTGASMRAALKKLQQAGAHKIVITVLAVSR